MTELKRFPDWPERLADFLETRRERVFLWASNDCCLFAADAVLAITGHDFAEGMRNYKDAKGAARLIKKVGGMRAFAADLQEKHAGLAQRGDVVLVTLDGRETFGIVAGNGHWCGPGESGLVFRPMSEVTAVWGV